MHTNERTALVKKLRDIFDWLVSHDDPDFDLYYHEVESRVRYIFLDYVRDYICAKDGQRYFPDIMHEIHFVDKLHIMYSAVGEELPEVYRANFRCFRIAAAHKSYDRQRNRCGYFNKGK